MMHQTNARSQKFVIDYYNASINLIKMRTSNYDARVKNLTGDSIQLVWYDSLIETQITHTLLS